MLRRSRGYAPEPLTLPFASRRQVLALGAELKSTVSVAKGTTGGAQPPHRRPRAPRHVSLVPAGRRAPLPPLRRVPEVVAHDLHPEYLSTKWRRELDLPTLGVQHHHAHVAACMVEHGRTRAGAGNRLRRPRLRQPTARCGVARCSSPTSQRRERVAHFAPCACPEGVAAIREPWRMGAVWCATASTEDDAARRTTRRGIDEATARAVIDLARRPASPVTTSAGRLFDAVAALLGGRQRVSYEAQAAIELEALARTVDRGDAPRATRVARPTVETASATAVCACSTPQR